MVIANEVLKPPENVNRDLTPKFDYAEFYQGAWDEKPATDYFQTFTAKGTSITRVGFNPYRKVPPGNYDRGTAYRKCTERQPFDLDMQIVEYRSEP